MLTDGVHYSGSVMINKTGSLQRQAIKTDLHFCTLSIEFNILFRQAINFKGNYILIFDWFSGIEGKRHIN